MQIETNADAVASAVQEMADELPDAARDLINEALQLIHPAVAQRAPVRTGRLRSGLAGAVRLAEGEDDEATLEPGTEYEVFVEPHSHHREDGVEAVTPDIERLIQRYADQLGQDAESKVSGT